MLRHKHLASYIITTVEFMGAEEDEAALVSVPPYHIAGASAVLSSVYAGRRVVYLPAFTPEAWVATVAAEAVTHAMVVPTMLGRILDILEATDERLPPLRHLSYGGGRMPVAVIERALRLLPHVDFVNAYGLTETSSTIAVLSPEDHRGAMASSDPAVRRRLGSVGRPLPSVEVEIRDATASRGAGRSRRDLGSRRAGRRASTWVEPIPRRDGWFPTRDSGWLGRGRLPLVERRLDDVIVRGGENMSPGEIEDVLVSHPGHRRGRGRGARRRLGREGGRRGDLGRGINRDQAELRAGSVPSCGRRRHRSA